jgi:universal stress protein A
MVTIRRILVPTDFSECSDAAVTYARGLADTFGSQLHLLHVVQDPYTQPWAAEAFPAPLGDMLTQWQEQARTRLQGLLPAGTEGKEGPGIVAVEVGSPFQQIIRYAEDHDIDLIVIGTHGRGPIGHMLLGSVAEKVVRKAPCPVLTVRHA